MTSFCAKEFTILVGKYRKLTILSPPVDWHSEKEGAICISDTILTCKFVDEWLYFTEHLLISNLIKFKSNIPGFLNCEVCYSLRSNLHKSAFGSLNDENFCIWGNLDAHILWYDQHEQLVLFSLDSSEMVARVCVGLSPTSSYSTYF